MDLDVYPAAISAVGGAPQGVPADPVLLLEHPFAGIGRPPGFDRPVRQPLGNRSDETCVLVGKIGLIDGSQARPADRRSASPGPPLRPSERILDSHFQHRKPPGARSFRWLMFESESVVDVPGCRGPFRRGRPETAARSTSRGPMPAAGRSATAPDDGYVAAMGTSSHPVVG